MLNILHCTRSYLVQNVNSAKLEKSWHTQRVPKIEYKMGVFI